MHISHRTSSTRCSSPSSVCNVYPPCFYPSSGGFSPARGCGGGRSSGYPSNGGDGTPQTQCARHPKMPFHLSSASFSPTQIHHPNTAKGEKRDTGDNIISASVCVCYSDLSPHITSPVPPPPPFFSPLSSGSPDRCVATLPSEVNEAGGKFVTIKKCKRPKIMRRETRCMLPALTTTTM